MTAEREGALFVVSAASGTGKTSLVRALLSRLPGVAASTSHTTRPPREGEIDGVHYHFVTTERFRAMRDRGEFLEAAEVFGNHYGTSESSVREQLAGGTDVVLEIDWQGARQIRKLMSCVGVFILPPSLDALRRRLEARAQDSPEVIERRMRQAMDEMSHYAEFDYLIVNEDFDTACEELCSVVRATSVLGPRQHRRHARLISSLLRPT